MPHLLAHSQSAEDARTIRSLTQIDQKAQAPSPLNAEAIKKDLRALAMQCPSAKNWIERLGPPEPRVRPANIATLAHIVCGQQISVVAARAIWQRLQDATHPAFDAPSILALGEEKLRALGLGKRKAAYIYGLAEAVHSKSLCLGSLNKVSDDRAMKQLTQLKGFGPWSAQIYLLSAEGRRDIWPAGDIALQAGLQTIFSLKHRPDPAQSLTLIEHWRPYRSVGALMTWKVYGSATLD